LCDLLEVADEILFSDIMRHGRENVIVANIYECKDLVYLQHDFKESRSDRISALQIIIELKLLVYFLNCISHQNLEHCQFLVVEAVEASDMINECGTDRNVVVQPQLIVLGVLP